ncbi:MAG: hypothetical protein SO206_06990 [Bacilli bacterium]|nr:hypothetical protein [Bacilli bacterium]
MNGTTAYALSKQYVVDTADSLGSLKGAPCTIKSITEVDGGQKVTFEWTGISGTKQTSEMTVKNGVSVTGISDKGNGKFTLLLSDGSETSAVQTIKGAPGTNGYTPVKGTDYWTESDKAEIQSYIDAQIGGALNGSY